MKEHQLLEATYIDYHQPHFTHILGKLDALCTITLQKIEGLFNPIERRNALTNISINNFLLAMLSEERLCKLFHDLSQCPRLRTVKLHGDFLVRGPALGLNIFERLRYSKSLKHLVLMGNNLRMLNKYELLAIFSPFLRNHSLESLNLSFNNLNGLDAEHLDAIFKQIFLYPKLQFLNLRLNNLGACNMLQLSTLFTQVKYSTTLTHLNLKDNDLSEFQVRVLSQSRSLISVTGIDLPPESILQQTLYHNRKKSWEPSLLLYKACSYGLKQNDGPIFETIQSYLDFPKAQVFKYNRQLQR